MLAEAFADERVTTVIAHTLPERNASNRVLEKAGFRFEGEAQEDDEVVWALLADPSGERCVSVEDDPAQRGPVLGRRAITASGGPPQSDQSFASP